DETTLDTGCTRINCCGLRTRRFLAYTAGISYALRAMSKTTNKSPENGRKLVREVRLQFFCDPAHGEWGLAHENTIEPQGDGFNAFWSGTTGIFHDVFEHAHEHTGYFQGPYAMNIGGEIAAM